MTAGINRRRPEEAPTDGKDPIPPWSLQARADALRIAGDHYVTRDPVIAQLLRHDELSLRETISRLSRAERHDGKDGNLK